MTSIPVFGDLVDAASTVADFAGPDAVVASRSIAINGLGCDAVFRPTFSRWCWRRTETRVVPVAHAASVKLRVLAGDAAAPVDNVVELPPRRPGAVLAWVCDCCVLRWVASAAVAI